MGVQNGNPEVCNHSISDRNELRILINTRNDIKIVQQSINFGQHYLKILSGNGLSGLLTEMGAHSGNLGFCNHSISDRNGHRILNNPRNNTKIAKQSINFGQRYLKVLSRNGLYGSLIDMGAQNGNLRVCNHNTGVRNGLGIRIYTWNDTRIVKFIVVWTALFYSPVLQWSLRLFFYKTASQNGGLELFNPSRSV